MSEPIGPTCPFCSRLAQGEELAGNGFAAALPDAYPLNPGHVLVVPRRHEEDYFLLTETEQSALWKLVGVCRARLQQEFVPDGFNVGVNIGRAAGQTVFHVHIHLIPRYVGDVEEPRGGVRWIIPARAPYWRGGDVGDVEE